jgi:glycerol uptake facilitator protein
MAKNSYLGELIAEFLGTMILILFGVGVVAQVVTNPDGAMGDHDSIAWAWGIGVILGVYVAGRISGAHINPAVTIALAAFKDFPWRKVLPYALAQTAGAFVAAIIVRFVYADLIARVDPGHTIASQGIFSTLPGNNVEGANVTIATAFFDQIVGTAILVFVVFALITAANNPPLANMTPVVIGLLVVGIGMAWGANAGYAINPARDFGPRLASWITGYETAMFDQNGNLYFWLPIVAPIIGGLLGGAAFKFLVERYLPAEVPEVTLEPIPSEATDRTAQSEPKQQS